MHALLHDWCYARCCDDALKLTFAWNIRLPVVVLYLNVPVVTLCLNLLDAPLHSFMLPAEASGCLYKLKADSANLFLSVIICIFRQSIVQNR